MFTLIYHTYIHLYFTVHYDERNFIKEKKQRWKRVLSCFTPSGSSLPIKNMSQIWIWSHSHTTLHTKRNVTIMCKGLQKDHDSLISMQDNFPPPPYSLSSPTPSHSPSAPFLSTTKTWFQKLYIYGPASLSMSRFTFSGTHREIPRCPQSTQLTEKAQTGLCKPKAGHVTLQDGCLHKANWPSCLSISVLSTQA